MVVCVWRQIAILVHLLRKIHWTLNHILLLLGSASSDACSSSFTSFSRSSDESGLVLVRKVIYRQIKMVEHSRARLTD
eukprot:scaffold36321_cov63-Attheya_sp.AAC.5